jgi:hypothetical protein
MMILKVEAALWRVGPVSARATAWSFGKADRVRRCGAGSS